MAGRGDASLRQRRRPLQLARRRPRGWEGEFDADAARATYRACLQRDDDEENE
jgi:hypothetical protein